MMTQRRMLVPMVMEEGRRVWTPTSTNLYNSTPVTKS